MQETARCEVIRGAPVIPCDCDGGEGDILKPSTADLLSVLKSFDRPLKASIHFLTQSDQLLRETSGDD